MAVSKFVWQGCSCRWSRLPSIFGSYLEHVLDRRGRLCAHTQLGRSVKRTIKKHVTIASEGNLGTAMRAEFLRWIFAKIVKIANYCLSNTRDLLRNS
jgi:hypothetical protein